MARRSQHLGMTASTHSRMDPETKQNAERILAQLRLSASEAIRLFYEQIELHRGLPFQLRLPDKEIDAG
jgi:DNA-damage-inducible protein J